MPKFNLYQSLHTTVIGPGGKPLEIQIRTFDMHQTAEFGVAAHWLYKAKGDGDRASRQARLAAPDDGVAVRDRGDPREFMDTLRIDLFEDEVFVFTPKGDVKSLAAGLHADRLRLRRAHRRRRHCVGAKVNGRIVPLHTKLNSGDIIEIITSQARAAGPRATGWASSPRRGRARRSASTSAASSARTPSTRAATCCRRRCAARACRRRSCCRPRSSPQIVKDLGYQKPDDLYVALGSGRIPVTPWSTRCMQRSGGEGGHAAARDRDAAHRARPDVEAPQAALSSEFGIAVEGMSDIVVRMAKCCKPIPGDEIVGYISLGKGITIHRARLQERARPHAKNRERFTTVTWEGLGGRPSGSRSRSRRSTATTCSRTSHARFRTRA